MAIGVALPVAAAGVGCDGDWADSPICRERKAAVDARARAEALLQRLTPHTEAPEPPIDPLAFQDAESLYLEGMALYGDEYFGDSATRFQSALDRLVGLDRALQESAAQRLDASEAALAEEDFEGAVAGYTAVLKLLPESDEAATGLATAKRGVAAQRLLERALGLIEQGDFDAAENKLESIPSGFLRRDIAPVRQQIQGLRQHRQLGRSMSRGFRHLDRAEWREAEAAFSEALRTDPSSVPAKDALEELRRRRANTELSAYRARLEAQVAAENWREAQTLLASMRELDPKDTAIAGDLARIGHLVDVEAQIDDYLSEPRRLASKGMREAASALLATVANSETYGARIMAKRARLLESFTTWTTPVATTILSDGRTEVRIHPGRTLGKFRERRLDLYPGDYVLSGRRTGYREVVFAAAVAPGASPLRFKVVCDERF